MYRLLRGEPALHEIRPAVSERVRLGRPPWLPAALRALDPMRAHQPLDLTSRGGLAGSSERLPGPPVAVGLVVREVHLADGASSRSSSTARSQRPPRAR